MAKPKLKKDLEEKISREEIFNDIKNIVLEVLNEMGVNSVYYTREEIDDMMKSHIHSDYITREEMIEVSNTDYGGLFDEAENTDTIDGGGIV